MTLHVAPELLAPAEPCDPSFRGRLWVKKGWNLFRGVVEARFHDERPEVVARLVREIVRREFKPGLIVPFAFGTVLRFDGAPPPASEMGRYVDTTARARDTWQWMIVCDEARKVAYGIHTWVPGYLRPVYDDVLKQLAAQGYACASQDKRVDEVFARLWSVRRILILVATGLALVLVAGRLLGVR